MRRPALPAAWAATAVFLMIAALAVVGAGLLVLQERSRLRLVAEYRAFQIVADLAQAYDRGETDLLAEIDGLVGFGVYSAAGRAEFRLGNAPASLDDPKPTAPASFDAGVVSFVRALGGGSSMRGRGWALPELGEALPDQALLPGMEQGGRRRQPAMMETVRLVYLAYRATALDSGERFLYLGGGLVGAALILAFALFFYFSRRLDAYRTNEAHNRELVALGEAARTLAHEIKNPLGVVKIQCAILKRNSDPAALRSVAVIEEETERLNSLVGRIRDFLANAVGRPERIDLASYLRGLGERYAEAVSVPPDVGGELPVLIDRGKLDQIVGNLIDNARESSDPPGRAELSLVSARGPSVVLQVADRGRGIPKADAARVFDLFFTTKPTGSGIGLAVARRFAEAAGGQLRHEERRGGGTVFSLSLPLAGPGGKR